jgi:hypothetical protein
VEGVRLARLPITPFVVLQALGKLPEEAIT